MQDEIIPLPKNELFKDAPCQNLSIKEVAKGELCKKECSKVVECLNYCVNNGPFSYMADMDNEMQVEWINKAIISGEKVGRISYARCYEHVSFINKKYGHYEKAKQKKGQNKSSIDYISIALEAECSLQNQSEPKIENISMLPSVFNDISVFPFDEEITYNINKYKYVGNDFCKNPDILVLGGEESIPIGIPYKYSWLKNLSDNKNLTINNLSLPNPTVFSLYKNFFYHLKNFGLAKNTIVILPEIHSGNIPVLIETEDEKTIYYNYKIDWDKSLSIFVNNDKSQDFKDLSDINDKKNIYFCKFLQESISFIDSIDAVCDTYSSNLILVCKDEITQEVLIKIKRSNFFGMISSNKNLNECSSHLHHEDIKNRFWNTYLNSIHKQIHIYEKILPLIKE